MGQVAFYIRQDICSGCHACQIACKDYKELEDERLFRHITETEGGAFTASGAGFTHDAYAAYTSMACNHCEKPACLAVCPAGAIAKDEETGIVTIDPEICIACKYCVEACPYGAPQYFEEGGYMTKCDFCQSRLEEGEKPVCVNACPFNALDCGELADLQAEHGDVVTTPGLPGDVTKPSIVITPHVESEGPAA